MNLGFKIISRTKKATWLLPLYPLRQITAVLCTAEMKAPSECFWGENIHLLNPV